VRTTDVKNIFVWGNHNKTMLPDIYHGTIKGEKITDVIKDAEWINSEFM